MNRPDQELDKLPFFFDKEFPKGKNAEDIADLASEIKAARRARNPFVKREFFYNIND